MRGHKVNSIYGKTIEYPAIPRVTLGHFFRVFAGSVAVM